MASAIERLRISAACALTLAIFWVLSGCVQGTGKSSATDKQPKVTVSSTGAVADGTTLCTEAIRKAIEQCAATGGGTVLFPKGVYFTGAVALKSNITLQLDEGATLKFSTEPKDYPLVRTRWEGVEIQNYSPLIFAAGCENVAIRGKGTIDGQGKAWWDWANKRQSAYGKLYNGTTTKSGAQPDDRVFGEKNAGLRPSLVEFYDCKHVLVEGVTLRESPCWTIHPVYSEDVTIRGVTIVGTGPNTDGIDPDSCQQVLIEKCTLDTGDDCVAIKSGRDHDGRRVGKICENVVVRNCLMKGGYAGVAIGSETAGGVRHVLVEDCVFDGTRTGVRMKTTRGRGGVVEDIVYRYITMRNISEMAISINMKYGHNDDESVAKKDESTPVFRDILLERLTVESAASAGKIIGLAESPVERITLRDATIHAKTGMVVRDVAGLKKENGKTVVESGEAWNIRNGAEIK